MGTVRGLLDTSVVLAEDANDLPEETAISAATLAELHFGVHLAKDEEKRALRLRRLSEELDWDSLCLALADRGRDLASSGVGIEHPDAHRPLLDPPQATASIGSRLQAVCEARPPQ